MQYKLVKYCEIDKYASKSYSKIHNIPESENLWDITQVDISSLPVGIDLLTHGSPCQSFSTAGKGAGGDKGSGTRSSLMWNSVEIIKHCRPKFVIWENVPNVLSPKHIHNFDKYIHELQEQEYDSYYQVVNSLEYGSVQRRKRILVVSIRKDISCGFVFPNGTSIRPLLKDVLLQTVEDKWYLTETQIERIHTTKYMEGNRRIQKQDYCYTLCARDFKDPLCICDDKGVRKLLPQEYWRIMGFSDVDFELAETVNSNSQLYKQAGNSIVLSVLSALFTSIQAQYPNDFVNDLSYLSLFSGVGSFEMALKLM